MSISKKRSFLFVATALIALFSVADWCLGQGTAFTYQGSLSGTNGPVNGSYDLTFELFNASSGGTQVGSTIPETGTSVSNGLFTVVLDFGTVFSGANTWLQIAVRTNGGGSYETLSPRQELTPAPYAITSENLDGTLAAVQLTGTLPSGVLSGTYPDAITLNNSGNSFTGNGSGLTSVDALTLGGLGPNNFWQTTGNAGTTPGVNFVGTTDGAALELSAPFVGVNRTTPITGSDVFSVSSPATNGQYGGMYMNTGAGGLPFYGYAVGGADVAWTFIDGNFNNSWFLYNGNYWLTVATNGNVGINNTFPLASLDLTSGNHWDVFNPGTPGDFRIAGGVGALKIGVATGGAGAGDVRIFAYGGTSRLILGSSTNDGVVTVTDAATVGIDTLTPGSTLSPGTYASLDVEGGTNTIGAFGNNTNFDGQGVVGEANNGPDAFGVWGFSSSGYGVYGDAQGGTGIGVLGEGSSTGVLGYSFSPTGAGVLAEGASDSSPALSINQGTFQVQGAGVNTATTAFVQFTTSSNVFGDGTLIDNPACNGDPNAILIITHNYSPPSEAAAYHNTVTGVYYDGANWLIFNEDSSAMSVGVGFNVLVIKN